MILTLIIRRFNGTKPAKLTKPCCKKGSVQLARFPNASLRMPEDFLRLLAAVGGEATGAGWQPLQSSKEMVVLYVLYVLLEKKNDGNHSNKESIPRP